MAVAALVSLEEYLHTSYRPDCDYVDGEVRVRNLGEIEHSSTQAEIVFYLRSRNPAYKRRVLTEQRVQVTIRRFRIPDVCVLAEDAPHENVVRTPPQLCIEILSKDDRMSEIMERVDDYFQIGVPACWIIDPVRRIGWVAVPGHLAEAQDGVLRSGLFEMPLTEVLA